MDQPKIDAILAFYNLLSKKLSLEECKKLPDVLHLLHTVVHLISKCTLAYQDYQNFGYKQTVEFLERN
uniref:Uncharacterized protein n=1 Tax=Ditylenchus dipsaci TaxID=166011 RepID=A0A915DZI7_9BILA